MKGTTGMPFRGLLPLPQGPWLIFSSSPAGQRGARDRDAAGGRALVFNREEESLLVLFVSLLTLTTFLALYVFRSFDDNRLTSWQWSVSGAQAGYMFFALLAGIVLAYFLSGTTLPRRAAGAVLFAASFAVAAIFWREPEVIIDAGRYFTQAKYLELYGAGYFLAEWGKAVPAWTDLPLIPFLYGLIFKFFGEARIAIQVFTTLLFSGTVVLTYAIGRTLWNETVGVIAGVLLLGMPYLLTQVPLMLVDVPMMFFMTLAVFTTIIALRRGGAVPLALSVAAIVLALLTKYSAWVMISVLPVIFLVFLKERGGVVLGRAAAIAGAAGLLIGAAVLWKYDVFTEQLGLLQNYQAPALGRWGESYVSTFLFQIHPFITLAALFSLAVAVARKDLRYLIVCWLVLLILILDIKRIRYLVPALPMLALMAAYGLRELGGGRIRRYTVSCIVFSALVTSVFGYLPFLTATSAENLKNAGEYLDSIGGENVEVVVLPQPRTSVNPAAAVPILDLFTRKRIVLSGASPEGRRPNSVETSPVRFTWEVKPVYYPDSAAAGGEEVAAIVVISDANGSPLPSPVLQRMAGHRLTKAFEVSDRVFRYKTIVRVYEPPEGTRGHDL